MILLFFTKIISKLFDTKDNQNGFFYGFCVDIISEVLSKGYQQRVLINKISAEEMYSLIQQNNNQENFLDNDNLNITMQENIANVLSSQAFQRVLEIRDAIFLAQNNPKNFIHITFDKNLTTVIKQLKLKNYIIENDKSNTNFDFLDINHETKTIRLVDSKSVDLFKAVSQINKGYTNCVYGVGVLDEVKREKLFVNRNFPEISPKIYKQLINSTNLISDDD